MKLFNRKKKLKQSEQELALRRYCTLERYEKCGMINIDISSSRVFFSSTLASCYLVKEEHWVNFLTRVCQWFEHKVRTELQERYFKDVEAKAVREARKKYAILTKAQINEIRYNARLSVDVDAVPAPVIESFDFVITSGTVFTKNSEIIVVGAYKKGDFTMTPYEDIARSVKQ